MSVDISIKGLPDTLAQALRRRAANHHRSLDQEVVGILEACLTEGRKRTFSGFVAEARARGMSTPAESAAMVREDRDGSHRR